MTRRWRLARYWLGIIPDIIYNVRGIIRNWGNRS